MESTEQRKIAGRYRKDKDKTKGITTKGNKVLTWDCPRDVKDKQAWSDIVQPLLIMGLIYEQDKLTVLQAFTILERLKEIKTKIKLAEQDMFDKPSDEKALLKYKTFCGLEIRYISKYNELMSGFFITPKQRIKAIIDMTNAEPKVRDAIDDFLDD